MGWLARLQAFFSWAFVALDVPWHPHGSLVFLSRVISSEYALIHSIKAGGGGGVVVVVVVTTCR